MRQTPARRPRLPPPPTQRPWTARPPQSRPHRVPWCSALRKTHPRPTRSFACQAPARRAALRDWYHCHRRQLRRNRHPRHSSDSPQPPHVPAQRLRPDTKRAGISPRSLSKTTVRQCGYFARLRTGTNGSGKAGARRAALPSAVEPVSERTGAGTSRQSVGPRSDRLVPKRGRIQDGRVGKSARLRSSLALTADEFWPSAVADVEAVDPNPMAVAPVVANGFWPSAIEDPLTLRNGCQSQCRHRRLRTSSGRQRW